MDNGRGRPLVGVYYFAGWWRELPNKYHVAGRDWRSEYPGRVPLLGQYNDPETMDREILAASLYGVDFFQILWYSQANTERREPHQEKLNVGVRHFTASRNAPKLRFTVEFVNHPPFHLPTDADWDAACREWCGFLSHPSYLRVGGRPVFKVHGLDFFQQQNGGDPERVRARLDRFREIARGSGLPDPLIGGGVMAGGVASGPPVEPYDFLTTYMDMPPLPQRETPYPYEQLREFAEKGWERYGADSQKPYVPYVPAGWDPRPWKDPRPSFDLPSEAQLAGTLRSVRSALDRHPKLGLPLPGGKTQPALLIYAWNEFGEGGILAPTRGEGYARLRAVRDVFGPRRR